MNQSYSDWIYIVSEEIVNGLRPDLKITPPAAAVETEKSNGEAEKSDGESGTSNDAENQSSNDQTEIPKSDSAKESGSEIENNTESQERQ